MTSSCDAQELAKLDEMIAEQRLHNRNLKAKYMEMEKESIKLIEEIATYAGYAIIFEDFLIPSARDCMNNVLTQYNGVAAHRNATSPIVEETISAVMAEIVEVERSTEKVLLNTECSKKEIENYTLELKELEESNENMGQESTDALVLKLKELNDLVEAEDLKYENNLEELKKQTMIYETNKQEFKEKQDESKKLELTLLNETNLCQQLKDEEDKMSEEYTTLESLVSNLINNAEKIEDHHTVDNNLDLILNKMVTLNKYMDNDDSTTDYGEMVLKQHMDEKDRCEQDVAQLVTKTNDLEEICNKKMEEIEELEEYCRINLIQPNKESPLSFRTVVLSRPNPDTNV